MIQTIWKAAYAAFGKEVYKAWPQICDRFEHALWLWNDEFGPLNQAQRDFATAKICDALEWAGKHPADQRYARFHASLTAKLNHDLMRAGLRERGDTPLTHEVFDGLLDVKAVPA